jgi:hypothetical protein
MMPDLFDRGISPANRGNPVKNAISRPEADRFHRKNTIFVNYLGNLFGVSAVGRTAEFNDRTAELIPLLRGYQRNYSGA